MSNKLDKNFELHCEICNNHIGNFNTMNLGTPISGAMFDTIGEGYTPPFPGTAPFEALFCPRCNHRAIIDPNRVKTEKGLLTFTVGAKGLNFDIVECIDPVTNADIIAAAQVSYSAAVTIYDAGIIILPQEVVPGNHTLEAFDGGYFLLEIEEGRLVLHHQEMKDVNASAEDDEPADQESALDEDKAGKVVEGTNAPETGDEGEGSEGKATGDGSDEDDATAGLDEESGDGDELDLSDSMLLGSNILPAMIQTNDGEVTLGEIVGATQEKSGLSVKEWNDLVKLDDGQSDKLLADEVELRQAIPNTHILWNKIEESAHLVDDKIVTGSEEEVNQVMYKERPKGNRGLIAKELVAEEISK